MAVIPTFAQAGKEVFLLSGARTQERLRSLVQFYADQYNSTEEVDHWTHTIWNALPDYQRE